MNAGFSNLTTLKAHLLAASLRLGTDYDAAIAAIGLGQAAAVENFCNRKLMRVVGDLEIQPADRVRFLLPRYPLETLTLVELKLAESTGWQALDAPPWSIVQTIDTKTGMVVFPNGNDVGPDYAQVRLTYTGGFFWEQLEPQDTGYPTAPPSGSLALPADLKLAWLLQCEIVWKMRDKLGTQIAEGEGKSRGPTYEINDLDLAPQVRGMLAKYVRWNLT